ncbi:MAG: hypothetical protein HYX20_04330 [Candidatus Yanofskybacteria bacterium]|nr:hypothetical protein [Candidatus Yanofskybacteria bacterium]
MRNYKPRSPPSKITILKRRFAVRLRARVLLALRDRRKTRTPPPVNPLRQVRLGFASTSSYQIANDKNHPDVRLLAESGVPGL